MDDINRIVGDLERQRTAIDRAIEALRGVSGGGGGGRGTGAGARAQASQGGAPRKRRLSAEGRRRIAEAARKRWAAIRAGQSGGKGPGKKAGRKAAKKTQAKAEQA